MLHLNMERYKRQIILPEIGEEGQKKILNSSVLLVGAGGLGAPIALYLAAAGVGRIGIIDGDTVSLSNLQRQILYTVDEVGLSKAQCAAKRLKALSPDTTIDVYDKWLTNENAWDIIAGYDIVVDGCDNYATRYIIDDVCAKLHRPYIYGAIGEFKGQLSVFNYKGGTRYSDVFPDKENLENKKVSPPGVIGTSTGVIGSLQATEAIKVIVDSEYVFSNRLFTIDLRSLETFIFDL